MVRLREIPRTATFAWSPGADAPLIVTGTRAGAVDVDFSDETKLELFDLHLDSPAQGLELQPITSISTDSRFYDIAWAPANADHPRGIIAGALENGSLDLWDAAKLIKGENAFMSRTTKHSGSIKSLQFNPLKPHILATSGAKGELFIYDIHDIDNPFRLGSTAARSDDLECVAWNRKVPHILATGGSGGFVTVWDLKTKKASLTLNNSRKAVGAIAWDPNNATKLLTATPDDSSPVIMLWDLRNSNAPERTLQGHDQGILSLSWCQQDSDLLISCGKDNRTLVWNPQAGERLGEFPEVTNWTFQTSFHPHNPALSATAGFDGKIMIQTLQNTNPTTSQAPVQSSTDGEDFFTKAQTQPQGASFSLAKPPKWLERPIGASFAFGGKLVSYSASTTAASSRLSQIRIDTFSVDSDVAPATEAFEKAFVAGDIQGICDTHISQAKDDAEKSDWQVLETLIAENPRKKVTEYLGFALEDDQATNGVPDTNGHASTSKLDPNSQATESSKKANRLSLAFADGADGDDFLSSIAATKGAKTHHPFHLISTDESVSGRQITKALILGQFETAMTMCIKEGRIADALIVANCGGQKLFDKAQSAYLAQKASNASYLRLLSSVIDKNLWDIVYNADLDNWKETMAALCTYADPTEFPDLCEALGDRIVEVGKSRDAAFCYLVGSKLEKVVGIWVADLEASENAGMEQRTDDSSFSIHARGLQSFIEKVTIFREVTKFQDSEKNLRSDWKLGPLYERYAEYADIVAAHGQFAIAERYLDLLPAQYPAVDVARNRIKLASRKADGKVQPLNTTARAAPTASYQPFSPNGVTPAQATPTQYTAPSTPAANPYAPTGASFAQNQQGYQQQQSQAYRNPMGQAPYNPGYSTGYGNLNTGYGAPAQSFGAPPPVANAQPSAPPPPKAKDLSNWNDTPMVTKPPIAKRTAPGAAAVANPYQPQQSLNMPPAGPAYGAARASPPPPPPKGPAPPRVSSPLTGAGQGIAQQQQARPSSTVNAYAPPPKATQAQPFGQNTAPPIQRGPSPFNPPPTNAPPTNRYAPSPVSTDQSTFQPSAAPPPAQSARAPPPPNPYAQQPGHRQAPNPYANLPPPPGAGHLPPASQQMQAPPSRPPTSGVSPRGGTPANSGPPPAAAPPKAKHPAGDRSHIPAEAQPLVDILGGEMDRVAAKAPSTFIAQVNDAKKRLNLLFDHLNNKELVKPDTVQSLVELARALQGKDYETASRLQVDIQSQKTDECGNWMVGVKRLIAMSKATP